MSLLPQRRSSRPRGRAQLAPAADRAEQAADKFLGELRTAPADGTSWPAPPDIIHFGGASNIGVMPVAVKETGRDTNPLAFRPRQDARETGPMQRMPKLRKVQQRQRPVRPADAAIFVWSSLIGQHIMKCGVCLRSRHADPTTASLPFTFEALRVSAYQAGWRLDRFARWACPACQGTPAYHAPYTVIHWDPDAAVAGPRGDYDRERQLRAAAEHDLILDVRRAAGRYRHAAGAS